MSSLLDIFRFCDDTVRMRLRNIGRCLRHRPNGRWRVAVVLFFTVAGATLLHAAPQAELWPRWLEHDAASQRTVDHGEWGRFLERYLVTGTSDRINRVRYAEVSSADRVRLQRYIRSLSNQPVSQLNRDEQLAYWTNLYNALTVELILEHYPVDSIRDITISGSVLNRHPWDAALISVEGEHLSLNDIEHRIMRPIWQDPRIHYVVNCASLGCPNLVAVPFTAENWQLLADQAAAEYINHPRGVDFSGRRPVLSSIFDWYVDDFGGDLPGVVAHVLEHAGTDVARAAREFAAAGYSGRVRYSYDWSLNEP